MIWSCPDNAAALARLTRAPRKPNCRAKCRWASATVGADYRLAPRWLIRAVWSVAVCGRRVPILPASPMMQRGRPPLGNLAAGFVGGTRERGVFALAAQPAVALAPGATYSSQADAQRTPSSLRDASGNLIKIPSSAANQGAQHRSIPRCSTCRSTSPVRRAPAIPAAMSARCMYFCSICRLLMGEDPPILTRLAVFADPWPGPVAIWASADGLSFDRIATALAPSVVGETLDPLPRGPTSRFDRHSRVRVRLYGGALSSVSDTVLLGGANAAAVQRADGAWEVIPKFANAELVDTNTYEIEPPSARPRRAANGRWAIRRRLAPPFVLLDSQLVPMRARFECAGPHGDTADRRRGPRSWRSCRCRNRRNAPTDGAVAAITRASAGEAHDGRTVAVMGPADAARRAQSARSKNCRSAKSVRPMRSM